MVCVVSDDCDYDLLMLLLYPPQRHFQTRRETWPTWERELLVVIFGEVLGVLLGEVLSVVLDEVLGVV